jgi:hypothetical protein
MGCFNMYVRIRGGNLDAGRCRHDESLASYATLRKDFADAHFNQALARH